VAIFNYCDKLAYIKSDDDKTCIEDKAWGFLSMPRHYWPNDFISYRGRISVVDRWSKVVSVDIWGVVDDDDNNSSSPPSSGVVKVVSPRMSYSNSSHSTYLVESSAGDLLLVEMFLRPEHGSPPSFKIFKLQFSSSGEEAKRVELKSLGDDTLFLCKTCSMAVSDFPECRPNSIYFADYYYLAANYPSPYDLVIFTFDDGSFQRVRIIQHLSQQHKKVSPVWIFPTMGSYQFCAYIWHE
ncbi:unnamed protein product, partial [Ilex paraguariensis]